VLEINLSGKYSGEPKDYLAGHGKGKYSAADIKTWPWVKGWERTGFTKVPLIFCNLFVRAELTDPFPGGDGTVPTFAEVD